KSGSIVESPTKPTLSTPKEDEPKPTSSPKATANAAPTLSITEPAGNDDVVAEGDTFAIRFAAKDDDETASVSLYYSSDNKGCSKGLSGWTEITSGLARAATTYSWNVSAAGPGRYYVCGVISDGVNPDVYAVSKG